jgi:hypothetical protein
MVSDLFFYQLGLIALVWLCLMLQWALPSDSAAVCPTTPELPSPVPKRHREPTPFAGLTTKPHCDACEHSTDPRPQPPSAVWSKNSCGLARVVFQEPAEPLTTLYRAFALCILAARRKEQHVALALMIPLVMKMLHVVRQRMA